MSNNQVNIKQTFQIDLNYTASIMEGGCVKPPINDLPIKNPPIDIMPIKPPFCWQPPIFGTNPPLPQGNEANVYRTGDGTIVLDAGSGNDNINVKKSPFGGVTVEVNGEKYHFTEAQAKKLEIRGGSGDDTINVSDKVKTGLSIKGGSGDDTIKGGSGNDRIDGGSGDDTIRGGRGHDRILGGTGDDEIHGGRGSDYIHGGAGDDDLFGGRGDDWLVGGSGDDNLQGGRGRDFQLQNDFFFSRLMNNLRRA